MLSCAPYFPLQDMKKSRRAKIPLDQYTDGPDGLKFYVVKLGAGALAQARGSAKPPGGGSGVGGTEGAAPSFSCDLPFHGDPLPRAHESEGPANGQPVVLTS